jgi:DNA-directed RNA polymerase subunit delta
MKLKNMQIEELELMSYTDMTYMILKENNKAMNTPTIFKEICDLLEYSEDEYVSKIGDYYTSLTLDKRFVLLDNNEWDIRDHHSVELVMDDDDTDDDETLDDNNEYELENEESEEDELDELDDILDDDLDDSDMDDLEIVTDEELEEEN